jgi:hypothetical protein
MARQIQTGEQDPAPLISLDMLTALGLFGESSARGLSPNHDSLSQTMSETSLGSEVLIDGSINGQSQSHRRRSCIDTHRSAARDFESPMTRCSTYLGSRYQSAKYRTSFHATRLKGFSIHLSLQLSGLSQIGRRGG